MAYTKKAQKETFVKDYSKKLKENGDFIMADYRGMSASEMSDLRKKIKETSFDCKVVKNTLMKRVLDELKYESAGDSLSGPIAMIFGKGDISAGAKLLINFSREHENLKLKAGFLNGRFMSAAQVKAVSMLPSREVLIAKVAGALNGPITSLAYGLKSVISGLAVALEGVKKKKEEAK